MEAGIQVLAFAFTGNTGALAFKEIQEKEKYVGLEGK